MQHTAVRAILGTILGLSLITSACGSSGGGSPSGGTIASKLTLGGPPECPKRPFCELGLQQKYGLHFKAFKALDAGGPLTKTALKQGSIDIGLIFSSDSSISVDNFVVLQDDKHLQNADAVVPVIRKAAAKSDVVSTLNNVSSKLTTADLVSMNKQADVDRQDPSAIAASWLGSHGFSTSSSGGSKGTITIGGFNFSESSILAQIYAQALKGAGYNVNLKLNLGSREVVAPALQRGDIDLYPGYAATELEFFDNGAGKATPDATQTVSTLNTYLGPKGLEALTASSALDANAFAVTKATADKYHLTKLSDLANSG